MAAPLLYLSGQDVQASALSPAELIACVERAFTLHAEGGVLTSPKTGLYAELVSGRRPGRTSAAQRIAFIHPGHAIGILAIAAALYERARAAGRGMELPIARD